MSEWYREGAWHLGASVEQLAREQYEEIMGHEPDTDDHPLLQGESDGPRGHKAPRADIAKLKKYYDMWKASYPTTDWQPEGPVDIPPASGVKGQWEELTMLNADEKDPVTMYRALSEPGNYIRPGRSQDPFNDTIEILSGQHPDWRELAGQLLRIPELGRLDMESPYTADEARAHLVSGLNKQAIGDAPHIYSGIRSALRRLLSEYPESYKLWPWLVKQIKARAGGPGPDGGVIRHYVDVVGEAGKELNLMRKENRVPADFDINKMDWQGLEDWWMEWKKEHRVAASQGEVVYQYHDGWTMQRLKGPEQLQFEGDEMGHCVGGYAHAVEDNSSVIYSLRDPKGTPHVTIELHGAEVSLPIPSLPKPVEDWNPEEAVQGMTHFGQPGRAVHPRFENEEEQKHWRLTVGPEGVPREKQPERVGPAPGGYKNYLHQRERVAPTDEISKAYHGSGSSRMGLPFDKVFSVVQIQGNSNQEPKAEYKRKVKEFFDALREQGIKLKRADDYWDPDYNGYDENIDTGRDIARFYDSFYNSQPDNNPWLAENVDEYGVTAGPHEALGTDVADFISTAVSQYIDSNQNEDPDEAARQIYYYASVRRETPEDMLKWIDASRENLDDSRQRTLDRADFTWFPKEEEFPDDDEYIKAQDEAEREYLGYGYEDAQKFLMYLSGLVMHHGIPEPAQLPVAGSQHRLPKQSEIRQLGEANQWPSGDAQFKVPFPQQNESFPGSFE